MRVRIRGAHYRKDADNIPFDFFTELDFRPIKGDLFCLEEFYRFGYLNGLFEKYDFDEELYVELREDQFEVVNTWIKADVNGPYIDAYLESGPN